MDYTKPLYLFVLATRSNHWEFDINEVLKKPIPAQNDPGCIRPSLSGGSLALGCWDRPKEAIGTEGGFYILVINNEIEYGTPFKWVDVSGQYEPNSRDSNGQAWEVAPCENRVFDIGRPAPGEAGACLCMSWGDPVGRVVYFPLPMEKEVEVVMEKHHVVQTERALSNDTSESEPCSPISNGSPTPDDPSKEGELIPDGKEAATPSKDRELIPDGKEGKKHSGHRSARKRIGDSFRRARKSIGHALSCGRGEYD